MKLQGRLVLSTIFVLGLLCFTFISVKLTRVSRQEKIKKEEAVSQIISVTPTVVAHGEKVKKKEAIRRITDYIRDENVELGDKELRIISEMVYKESMRYNIDYRLVLALIKIESNFRCDAVSRKGARGLLQVKPSLAKYIAEDVGIRWRGLRPSTNRKRISRLGCTSSQNSSRTSRTLIWPSTLTTLDLQGFEKYLPKGNTPEALPEPRPQRV